MSGQVVVIARLPVEVLDAEVLFFRPPEIIELIEVVEQRSLAGVEVIDRGERAGSIEVIAWTLAEKIRVNIILIMNGRVIGVNISRGWLR